VRHAARNATCGRKNAPHGAAGHAHRDAALVIVASAPWLARRCALFAAYCDFRAVLF
jgi:hypothetical protein